MSKRSQLLYNQIDTNSDANYYIIRLILACLDAPEIAIPINLRRVLLELRKVVVQIPAVHQLVSMCDLKYVYETSRIRRLRNTCEERWLHYIRAAVFETLRK